MCCIVLDEVCHYVMALFKETISMYIVILSTSQLSCSQGLKLLPASLPPVTCVLSFYSSLHTMPFALHSTMRNTVAFFLRILEKFSFFFPQLNSVVYGGKHSSMAWRISVSVPSAQALNSHIHIYPFFSLLFCPCSLVQVWPCPRNLSPIIFIKLKI